MWEMFRRLHPGMPLMALHGKLKQERRLAVYYDFVSKPAACMFATDLAARYGARLYLWFSVASHRTSIPAYRGLDFPEVDWVVQLDCPESCETYIHRVGRTARCVLFVRQAHHMSNLNTFVVSNRYKSNGKALLLLLPSEEAMLGKVRSCTVAVLS